MATFKVGDAVRVKAVPFASFASGVKLIVSIVEAKSVQVHVEGYGKSLFYFGCSEIEPWNDAEEWDGSKWVAKKVAGTCKPGVHLGVDLPCDLWANGSDVKSVNVNGIDFIRKPVEPSSPKPAIVCLRENGKLQTKCPATFDSTNEAFRKAEEWANTFPGVEYVVLQEKGSRRVEKQKPEPKFKVGDFVRAVRDTESLTGLKAAKDQIVRVMGEPGETLFTGSPLPGNRRPSLRIADFELIT